MTKGKNTTSETSLGNGQDLVQCSMCDYITEGRRWSLKN